MINYFVSYTINEGKLWRGNIEMEKPVTTANDVELLEQKITMEWHNEHDPQDIVLINYIPLASYPKTLNSLINEKESTA